MFCNVCGANNGDGQKFCAQCGSPLNGGQAQTGNAQYGNAQYGNAQYGNAQYNSAPQYGQQQYGQPQPVFFGGISQRSLPAYVIASLFIPFFLWYWIYCITEDTNKLSGDPGATTGGMVILFSLLTCGIYTLYWYYKRGEIIDNFLRSRGMMGGDKSVIYLVLGIVGLGIVSDALIQNELNKIAMGM